ncbi:MAG: hypothetical protein O7H41_16350 [Planctomycetota bacterium]|nr:hypothetical protein [Planctomycetota bacterium]
MAGQLRGGDPMPRGEDLTLAATDVVMRIKEGYEDKKVGKIKSVFHVGAKINVDGRFLAWAKISKDLKVLFDNSNQTFLDILGVKDLHGDEKKAFAVYEMEAAHVSKEDLKERSHRFSMSLELGRASAQDDFLVDGLTIGLIPGVPHIPGTPFPADVIVDTIGTGSASPWDIWY